MRESGIDIKGSTSVLDGMPAHRVGEVKDYDFKSK